jgi:hypothetical protein
VLRAGFRNGCGLMRAPAPLDLADGEVEGERFEPDDRGTLAAQLQMMRDDAPDTGIDLAARIGGVRARAATAFSTIGR